ncbi:MAG: tyrosine-protein phosphatase [Clostridiales bacterium]|nr:tyrosine-protein phosphatase [Clostridiales bacterium]
MAGERIQLDGLINTRDLGGYRTRDGRRLKKKRVLRSGALCIATEQDIQILTKQYELKKIIDFRTKTERVQKPDPEIMGVDYVVNEILQEAQLGITHEGEKRPTELLASMIAMCREVGERAEQYLAGLYPKLVTDENCIRGYRRFFEILLTQQEGAVLYHCSEGKDRVGTATALFLSALGVEREVILSDYLLTNDYTEEKRRDIYEKMKEKTPEEPGLAERFLILNSVHRSYLESLFDTIDQRYGSMDCFLQDQMGLVEEKRDRLQQMYLE